LLLSHIVLSAAVAAALAAVELKDLNRAVLALAAMSVLVALAHYLAGAWLLAVFQLSVYGGAVTMLMLAAVHSGGERGE
jgi:NADH:ubiquinone oxidoreductase subunit 6 (subunit J)